MKHSIEDLLFANEMRKRAQEMRRTHLDKLSPEEQPAALAEPANKWVEAALEEVERIADLIAATKSPR